MSDDLENLENLENKVKSRKAGRAAGAELVKIIEDELNKLDEEGKDAFYGVIKGAYPELQVKLPETNGRLIYRDI